MKEANSFPTKITISKQSDKVISSPWLCLPNPLLNFRLFLFPLLCLCLPQFLKKSVTTKSLFYRFGLSFTLLLSLSQKWNFRFCKFKKLECSPVTFAFFFHFSPSFCWVFLAYSDLHFVFRPSIHLPAEIVGIHRYGRYFFGYEIGGVPVPVH